MSNPDVPGQTEGFYCNIQFNDIDKTPRVQVATLIGKPDLTDIHFNSKQPLEWCTDIWSNRGEYNCKRANNPYSWMAFDELNEAAYLSTGGFS